MKTLFLLPAVATAANPVGQVLDLLSKLYNTVVNDGEVEQKQFESFAEWCEDEAKQRQYEIKTGKAQADSLRAVIEKAGGDISANNQRIAELSQNVAANQADLEAATSLRKKEHTTFKGEEKELVDTVDMLRRAQSVLSRQLKSGGSFAQLPEAFKDLTNSLSVIMDASVFSTMDKSKLKAFLQAQQEGVNAPEAAAYESHSSGILDTLADMQEKAEGMLSETRKTEVNNRHAFELLAQSLRDELKVQNEALSNTKKQLAATAEVKGQAEGDLANTSKDLQEDQTYVKELSLNCQQRAVDHEVSLKSRQEELNALREAKKIIAEATGGAASRQYKLVQVNASTKSSLYEDVEKKIKLLGKKEHNSFLVQLAGQIRAAVSMNADPFAKVKGLISNMITRLITEAQEEASHKAFCDKETADNEAKRNKLQAEQQKLSTRIERADAGIANLKQEIAELNQALADIAASQKSLDAMRASEHEEFQKEEVDFQEGLRGIRSALKILREYYQNEGAALVQEPATSVHGASSDAGNGIISILEVAESDFARSLAEAQAAEDDATSVYEKTTQENKVSTATKRTNAEGKTQESARLAQLISDASSDRDGVQEELNAVLEYLEKLRPQCTTEPMSYEERKARREHEIEGLKQALNILENETALVQESASPSKSFLAARQ
jgi:chromosome segregation ATPase